MMECVNGHVFCCDEAFEQLTKKEIIKIILENEYNKNHWDSNLGIYKDFTEEEISAMDEIFLFDEFVIDGSHYEVPEYMCPICQFIEYSESDLSKYLLKEYGVSRDEVFAEVKQFNRRRRRLYESEYITYVCKKFNLNPIEIVASWKEKFDTYSNFKKWLNS